MSGASNAAALCSHLRRSFNVETLAVTRKQANGILWLDDILAVGSGNQTVSGSPRSLNRETLW
jgi:hypothetical protein